MRKFLEKIKKMYIQFIFQRYRIVPFVKPLYDCVKYFCTLSMNIPPPLFYNRLYFKSLSKKICFDKAIVYKASVWVNIQI
jgi:hypothetical protein